MKSAEHTIELLKSQAMTYYWMYLVTKKEHYLHSAYDLGFQYRYYKSINSDLHKLYQLKLLRSL